MTTDSLSLEQGPASDPQNPADVMLDDVRDDMNSFNDQIRSTETSVSLPVIEFDTPTGDANDAPAAPPDEPKPKRLTSADDVRQGPNGDCFYMAALAGLANSDRGSEMIQNMLRVNNGGESVTVTFPGAPNDPIEVTRDDLARLNVRGDQQLWASVMEAAFLKYTHDTPIVGGVMHQYNIPTFGRATSMRSAMQLLTGTDVANDNLAGVAPGTRQIVFGATSQENVRRDLESAFANDSIVTAAAVVPILSGIVGHDSGPLPDSHAYTVLGYNRATDTVRVRNPWGAMSGPLAAPGATADGITHLGNGNLEMSFSTFYERFGAVHYSNTDAVLNPLQNVGNTILDAGQNLRQAATNVISGDFRGAANSAGDLVQNQKDLLAELLHASTSAIWYPLADHPEDLLQPPPLQQPIRILRAPAVQNMIQNAADAGRQAASNAWDNVRQHLPWR